MQDGKLRRGPDFTAGEIGMLPCGNPAVPSAMKTVEDLISLEALKKRFGFDRHFGIQSLNPQARAQMTEAVADVISHVVAAGAAILNVCDFVLGGITVDLLGEDLFEAVRRRISASSPLSVNLHSRRLNSPALAGAARKVIDTYVRTLLVMDSEKENKREENK